MSRIRRILVATDFSKASAKALKSAIDLAKLAGRARTSGVHASTKMVIGDPSRHIVRTARSLHADLIVVGTHGRQGLTKLFLGSVAERVIATAPCPIMTIRRAE